MASLSVLQAQQVSKDALTASLSEGCVQTWLGGLRKVTRPAYRSLFKYWLLWLWKQQGWDGKRPSELLDWQENAQGRQRRLLLMFMQEFVQLQGGTYGSMIVNLSHLRSFFIRNGVEIPLAMNWNPEPTKEPIEGRLTVDQVREIILHSKLRDQAIFLTMFQAMLDLERFTEFNRKCSAALVNHIKTKGVDAPFRIDFLKGRKQNKKKFYTFIHKDALTAWQIYFDRVRGWPKEGEALALHQQGDAPLAKQAIRPRFDTVARQLRIKPPMQHAGRPGGGTRTGVAPHEAFRDVVRSLLQTAKAEGFDPTVAEFWMGHTIDPYRYNKFAELEPEYVIENAKIAARYVNIITNSIEREKELKKRDSEKDELRAEVARQGEELRRLRSEFETQVKKRGFSGS